jgi:GT2 family glycosyltransferase
MWRFNLTIVGYFDTISGSSLYGWAIDTSDPTGPAVVQAVTEDGRIIGSAKADGFRGDLLTAGVGNGGRCAFKIDINGNVANLIGISVKARVVGTNEVLAGSPRRITLNQNHQYLLSRTGRAKRILKPLRARLDREAKGMAVSIVMPIFNTPQGWLIEALESVRAQWCSNWELILVNDGSTARHIAPILEGYQNSEPRFRVITSPRNLGIAKATNFGLRAAKYEYVAFMDHDDYLEPHAVWSLIRAAQKSHADLIYSDEVVTSESINHILDVRARPAFSYDYYLSHPYFVHLLCVKRDLAYCIQGWDESLAISADIDFVLRILEKSETIAHIASSLYRWRTHGESAGHAKQNKVTVATTASIQNHLDRMGLNAVASPGVSFNQYHVKWPTPSGRTLIVVPTKNGVDLLRLCVQGIQKTVDPSRYHLIVVDHQSTDRRTKRYLRETVPRRHTVMPYEGAFNFSRMNNLAVERYGGDFDFVLFMNNDVEAKEHGWLERLASLAARKDVGAVGPTLLFADRRIQHAGVIIGYCDAAEHVGKFVAFEEESGARTLGANCTLTSVRDFSAVTAACLMMRRSVFIEAGGFQEILPVAFNDTDLCLRIRDLGYRVLYDGHTWLYHHESATRANTNDLIHPRDTELFQATWKHLMRGADPFYHPALSLAMQDHVLASNLVTTPSAPRVVTIRL